LAQPFAICASTAHKFSVISAAIAVQL
jgi:hypothetical protein